MENMGRFFQLLWMLGAGGVLGSGIYASAIERHWLDVRKISISLTRLPRSFSGLRILLLSDIHLGFFYHPKNFSNVVDIINKLEPNVICLTGDFVDLRTSINTLKPAISLLSRLKASFGKYAVLGNHDYRAGAENVNRVLECGGFRVLINEHHVLKQENDRLYLIGIDDIIEGKPNMSKAIEGIPENACKILMVHEPDSADYMCKFPIDLQLSGHSHGGQICLPFVGPIITTTLGGKYHTGLYKVGELTLYTNKGVGTTILPLRFLCRPEITFITLETGF